MSTSSISDERLDAMRLVADPLVDGLLERYFVEQPEAPGKLLSLLFNSPELPLTHALVSLYLNALPALTIEDPARLQRGQEVFDLYAPEALLSLGSCSLPLAYAAGNGVQVVARGKKFAEDPIRRLCDTAQMVINVMQPGELVAEHVGWQSMQKVRLLHALVRRHILNDSRDPWNASWGVPINQEDLTGTMLTFSVGVLQSLRKMGARISTEDGDAYVYAWGVVARGLGLDETLVPASEAEGMSLALRIGRRQVRETKEGRALNKGLLDAVESLLPIAGYATSLNHFFLRDSAFGSNVIQVLDIPKPNWTTWLVDARALQVKASFRLLDWLPGAKARRRFVARHFTQAMLELKRPDGRVPFAIPESLRRRWGLEKRNRFARRDEGRAGEARRSGTT